MFRSEPAKLRLSCDCCHVTSETISSHTLVQCVTEAKDRGWSFRNLDYLGSNVIVEQQKCLCRCAGCKQNGKKLPKE